MPYVLRSMNDVKLCTETKAHGGKGNIHVHQLLGHIPGSNFPGFPEDFDSPINFLHHVRLEPHSSIGMHPHDNNEEYYYIIKGTGTMIVDDKSLEMKEGSVCLIKKGSKHAFENNTNEDLLIMVLESEFK